MIAARVFVLTFNLAGGTLDGKTGTFTIETLKNRVIIIPEGTPVREGYTFLYWKGSIVHPGQEYKVTKNHIFTAKWRKKGAPAPDESEKATYIPPKTGIE